MDGIEIRIMRLPHCPADIEAPSPQTEHSAGHDLRAANAEPVEIEPGGRALIPSGFAMAIPPGFEVQVRPRSGLAWKHGVILPNSPGTIDADYRGEVKVILMNLGTEVFTVNRGDRIAQLVAGRVVPVRWAEVGELGDTGRGDGGFGHTGR